MKSEPIDHPSFNQNKCSGLTKREYFSAMAMQGLLASNALYGGKENKLLLTRDAVLHADDLIHALNTNTTDK